MIELQINSMINMAPFAENDYFSARLIQDNILCIASKCMAGGAGTLRVPASIIEEVLAAVVRPEQSKKRYLTIDPFWIESSAHLLRDDLRGGWVRQDDLGNAVSDLGSATFDGLEIVLEHPGDGRIGFGEPSQEAEQLAAFLSLSKRAAEILHT